MGRVLPAVSLILLSNVISTLSAQDVKPTSTKLRNGDGLLALYEFKQADGSTVLDTSGVQPPVHLRIADPSKVRRSAGRLEIISPTLIRTINAPRRINDSIRKSGELTLEVWAQTKSAKQEGPARLVTISKNSTERNATIGQEKDRYEFRLRSSSTTGNGVPAIRSRAKTAKPELTHIVYTRDRSGRTRVFINGRSNIQGNVKGSLRPWDNGFQLGLANELNRSRPWLGTLHLVAVYKRDLSPREVYQNFQAGPAASTAKTQNRISPQSDVFLTKIAPLLSKHCLECHDTTTKKGGLDLSQKVAALAGGESGKAIVAGKAKESILWEQVSANDMPKDRPALSAQEKKLLHQWIQSGANWTLKEIDAATIATINKPQKRFIRRLTLHEYIESVRSALGVDISQEARATLPKDLRADGFNNTAYNLNVDLKHIEAYGKLAEKAVGKMDVAKFARRYSRKRLLTDPSMQELVKKMGKWILRGPLEEQEVASYVGISTTVASTGGDYDESVSYIIQAMLQSPRFLYRIENQRGDGTSWPAGEYELASRISYIVWGAPPDKTLMDAAEKGELSDESEIRKQVARMLADPRAIARSQQFMAQWINIDRLFTLKPNAERFPQWSKSLAEDMRAETLAYFNHVVWQKKRPLSELFTTQVTFATPRLAKLYGLPSKGDGLQTYDVSKIPGRGGLLTQGSVLTIGGDEASMVARGLFVLTNVLRGSVKDPPPCVDTTPVPTKKGLTQRGIAEARIANANCGGCHRKFEPLAFGLEKFDALGAFHEKDEHGNKLRDDGKIVIPGQGEPIAYQNSQQLMQLLGKSDRVAECITWKLTQFCVGRPLTVFDISIVDTIHEKAVEAGGTYPDLITAIVLSDLVQMTRTETGP